MKQFIFILIVLFSACQKDNSTTTATATQSQSTATKSIKYECSGDLGLQIEYNDASGAKQSTYVKQTAWDFTFTSKVGSSLYIKGSGPTYSTVVNGVAYPSPTYCRVKISCEGVVIKEAYVKGIAEASITVP